MLYYNINYYHNRLFYINEDLYIYIYDIPNVKYIYNFIINENNLELEIINKKKFLKEKIKFKLINNNNELNFEFDLYHKNIINIGNLDTFIFNEPNILENNIKLFSHKLDIEYYLQNNKLINIDNDIKFIKYHWYLCGRFHPYIYFKYLLKKFSDIIMNLNYPLINYDSLKNNTLLFIDDRYDLSFIYILKLFLFSVDESWNLTIFTSDENKEFYQKDIDKLKIKGRINIIDKFKNMEDYSNLLKNYKFWKLIQEENVLLFQYDSFCMGKFDNIFFNYNYIGARWPHDPFKCKISIGNGGTSFRKTRIMEKICIMYNNKQAEDLFFSYYLHLESLNNCNEKIADKFSFENIFINDSIYAHQIYNTIKLEDLEAFMYNKLKSL